MNTQPDFSSWLGQIGQEYGAEIEAALRKVVSPIQSFESWHAALEELLVERAEGQMSQFRKLRLQHCTSSGSLRQDRAVSLDDVKALALATRPSRLP